MRALTILLAIALLIPGTSLAQLGTSGFSGGPQLALQPAYPQPYSSVQVSLNDYSTDANGATISWRVDGVVDTTLTNQRSITIPVGAPGKTVSIDALLTLPDGTKLSARRTITPTYIDLIVEPQTRVPAFYQGRPLPSLGSVVNVTALTDAGNVPSSELVYKWYLNNKVLLGGPVRGQNQISIPMNFGGATLEVEIEHITRGVIGNHRIQLINSEPQLRFYEVNSLYGSSFRPLSTLTLTGNSATVRAEPYHLDLRTYNNPSILEWKLGGIPSPSNSNPYEITLIKQGGGEPITASFHVRSLSQVLQGAEASFRVQ